MIRATILWASIATVVLLAVVLALPLTAPWVHQLYPELTHPIYGRASFLALLVAHVRLVGLSTGLAGGVAIVVGIVVSQPAGAAFASLARTIATIGQTFPPVAVLALSVPLLGYGAAPTLAALAIYAALPVLEATLTGLASVPSAARDAARGLGFSNTYRLLKVDLPLALPLIVTGLRNATIIAIGTATIGSSVGALSLGSPIIEGLSASNPAYVIEGATVVALLAVAVDRWFDVMDTCLAVAGR